MWRYEVEQLLVVVVQCRDATMDRGIGSTRNFKSTNSTNT